MMAKIIKEEKRTRRINGRRSKTICRTRVT